MKDNFSIQSKSYSQYRPEYPAELVEFIIAHCNNHRKAWDCGTGNGQFANKIAPYFEKVYATDLSERQLEQAVQKENIFYSVAIAGENTFSENNFDLISIAQAVHWFNFDSFYQQVKEKLNKSGIIALIGYGLLSVNKKTDKLIEKFYSETLNGYWDAERRYLDEEYLTLPFPFNEIPSPRFEIKIKWSFEHFISFFSTWSAVQHFKNRNNADPIDESFINEFKSSWGNDEMREISFPVYLRLGTK